MLNHLLERLPGVLGKAFEVTVYLFFITALAIVLYSGISIVICFIEADHPEECPQCGEHGLRLDRLWTAQLLIDGQRTGDSWTDHECEKCAAHLRKHRGCWEEIEGNLPRYLVDSMRYDPTKDDAITEPKVTILALSSR
jgi:hypothetical protein